MRGQGIRTPLFYAPFLYFLGLASEASPMIPRIIHQTWKNELIPERFQGFVATWKEKNPAWEYRFWTDRDLLDFVAKYYPESLALFCSYRSGVQRADAGRYLLLHHFGGIYADIDAECRQSLEPLVSEGRLILCHEPKSHWPNIVSPRGLSLLLFNGVMASPAKHAFWMHLIDRMGDVVGARDVLDSTGPILLTAAYLSFSKPDKIRIESEVFFNPVDTEGKSSTPINGSNCYSVHHWAATWWSPEPDSWARRTRSTLAKGLYTTRNWFTEGKKLNPAKAREAVSRAAISAGYPSGNNIAILVPVRDGAQHISGFLALIEQLEFPKERIKLVFCEGDSIDDSFDQLVERTKPFRASYREILILRKETGTRFKHSRRWLSSVQRDRRAGLAKVRNHLIDHGLDESDDWALWIDIDVWRFSPDIIEELLSAKARIVVPNCVNEPGGESFDTNSFASCLVQRDYRYYRMIKGGLFQPPAGYPHRLNLSDLRHSDRVLLDSVGGTMLLVDAALHRGGLRFPELPYDNLIETEAFGRLARDCGVTPIGLPRVEIMHVPW